MGGNGSDRAEEGSYGDEAFVAAEARRLIVPGFLTRDDVRSHVAELVEDDEDVTVDVDTALAIVDRLWTEQLARQRTWHGLSDADRLESAFAELEAGGIVARMNFTCCQNCGHTEIDGEVPEGASPVGYVFFHQQDADRLADGSALYLAYGAFPPDDGFLDQSAYEEAATEVGRRIVRAVEAAGVRVLWDGTLASRICLPSPDWRRPVPS